MTEKKRGSPFDLSIFNPSSSLPRLDIQLEHDGALGLVSGQGQKLKQIYDKWMQVAPPHAACQPWPTSEAGYKLKGKPCPKLINEFTEPIVQLYFSYLCYADQLAFRLACKQPFKLKMLDLKQVVIDRLNELGVKGEAFMTLLETYGGVLHNEFLLQCIYGVRWPQPKIEVCYIRSKGQKSSSFPFASDLGMSWVNRVTTSAARGQFIGCWLVTEPEEPPDLNEEAHKQKYATPNMLRNTESKGELKAEDKWLQTIRELKPKKVDAWYLNREQRMVFPGITDEQKREIRLSVTWDIMRRAFAIVHGRFHFLEVTVVDDRKTEVIDHEVYRRTPKPLLAVYFDGKRLKIRNLDALLKRKGLKGILSGYKKIYVGHYLPTDLDGYWNRKKD